jgi:hypothetical protein
VPSRAEYGSTAEPALGPCQSRDLGYVGVRAKAATGLGLTSQFAAGIDIYWMFSIY